MVVSSMVCEDVNPPPSSTNPPINLLDLAQQTERLDHGLGDLEILGCILLQYPKKDWQGSFSNLLATATVNDPS